MKFNTYYHIKKYKKQGTIKIIKSPSHPFSNVAVSIILSKYHYNTTHAYTY